MNFFPLHLILSIKREGKVGIVLKKKIVRRKKKEERKKDRTFNKYIKRVPEAMLETDSVRHVIRPTGKARWPGRPTPPERERS